jgi:hypothetical protein
LFGLEESEGRSQYISFNLTVQENEKAIVVVMALSDEGESSEVKLEIAWDGIWSADSDEIVRHMVVKQLNNSNECTLPFLQNP